MGIIDQYTPAHMRSFIQIKIQQILLPLLLQVSFTGNISAQVFIENNPNGNAVNPSVLIYGTDGIQMRIPYEKVKGTAFWNDEWKLATLYGTAAKDIWVCKTRLNLATGEVHFLDRNNEEMVPDRSLVKKIIFHRNNDTSTKEAVFIANTMQAQLYKKEVKNYFRLMNDGAYKLLKLHNRIVTTGDSLFGTQKRYYFTTEIKYFISSDSKTELVKKMNKEGILLFLPGSSEYKDWITKNDIDFRKEDDLIRFLDYYNSVKK